MREEPLPSYYKKADIELHPDVVEFLENPPSLEELKTNAYGKFKNVMLQDDVYTNLCAKYGKEKVDNKIEELSSKSMSLVFKDDLEKDLRGE